MDLLNDMDLGMESWHILSRTAGRPPQYIAPSGSIVNSVVTEGCEIYGSVENSILSVGVVIEEGAVVKDSVIMENVRICRNAVVNYAILDEHTIVSEGSCAGMPLGGDSRLTVYARGSVI